MTNPSILELLLVLVLMFNYSEATFLNPGFLPGGLVSCCWASLGCASSQTPSCVCWEVCPSCHWMYFSCGSWFANVLVLLAVGAAEVRSSWAGDKSCLWDTLQRICFHRLYCIMAVWLLVLGWFVLYEWWHQPFSELCSHLLHLLMHFLCSVLLAWAPSEAAVLSEQLEPAGKEAARPFFLVPG